MLDADGGCDSAVTVRSAWKKFREYLPILTGKGFSLTLKGMVYATRVRSCLVHGSETWPMKVEHELKQNRTEMSMIRWMCGVKTECVCVCASATINTGHILQVWNKILAEFPIASTMIQQVSELMHPDCKLSSTYQLLLLLQMTTMYPLQFNIHLPSTQQWTFSITSNVINIDKILRLILQHPDINKL